MQTELNFAIERHSQKESNRENEALTVGEVNMACVPCHINHTDCVVYLLQKNGTTCSLRLGIRLVNYT